MIVRCIKVDDEQWGFRLYKKYIVYALRFEETKVSFLIYDTNRWYPFFYDSKYFEIIDRGLAENNRDLISMGLSHLSQLVATSPFSDVATLSKKLESKEIIEI